MACANTKLRVAVVCLAALAGGVAQAATLEEYKHFRALSIDLAGRMPTSAEVDDLASGALDVNAWIDQHVQGRAYAQRVKQVYMDLLRLELSNVFTFQGQWNMRRQRIYVQNADGGPPHQEYVYYRRGQRRNRPETDGIFCLSSKETGEYILPAADKPVSCNPDGGASIINGYTPVPQAVLDQYTTQVKPWWLYSDYAAGMGASDRYDPATWGARFPNFTPTPNMLKDPVTNAPTQLVRVCNEEASPDETADGTGRITVRGQSLPDAGTVDPCVNGRVGAPPADSAFARSRAGTPIPCNTAEGVLFSSECGCGKGLERCLPQETFGNDGTFVVAPQDVALGLEDPLSTGNTNHAGWESLWWSQEAGQFLQNIVEQDRDFRDVLLSHGTWVNGPLAQFYKHVAQNTCCSSGVTSTFRLDTHGWLQADPLFLPSAVPANTTPHDTARWQEVVDRGPHASGLLTMPIFLTKYGTRRARAHILYNVFQCKEFLAENVDLAPSDNPNLMQRQGCNQCHATLEPMAAYFSRIRESDWTYLPQPPFAREAPAACMLNDGGLSATCAQYYDLSLPVAGGGAQLRGAYANDAFEGGPAALAQHIVGDTPLAQKQFGLCVARNMATAFSGRLPTQDDAALLDSLATAFMGDGSHYSMRALVTALVKSDLYKRGNNLSSSAWRQTQGGAP